MKINFKQHTDSIFKWCNFCFIPTVDKEPNKYTLLEKSSASRFLSVALSFLS